MGAPYGAVTLLSKLDLLQVGGGLQQGFAFSPILFTVLKDRILGRRLGEGLQLGDLKISELLFTDAEVLRASSA